MILDHRPCDTNSKGERDIYTIFKMELPDSYVVIQPSLTLLRCEQG